MRLIKALSLPESDEPDYRTEGTAAHEGLADCLTQPAREAWEIVGDTYNGIKVDVEMADAIQVFLDVVWNARHSHGYMEEWIEQSVANPEFHPKFYGTLDHGGVYWIAKELWLDIDDFKYGMGVVVEAWKNPQIMYYAYGKLCQLGKRGMHPDKVRLRIIQPRAFHPDGPVREWVVDAASIRLWAEGTLRPGMLRTEDDDAPLWAGAHCRFCPAKIVCPVMDSLIHAAVDVDPDKVKDISTPALDASYPLIAAAKSGLKALEDETFRRLSYNEPFAHAKLVNKKANRVFKPEAKAVLLEKLGADKVLSTPELMSPAQIESLGGIAKTLVHEYAYTPESGLTVAPMSDKRVAVKVPTEEEAFASYLEKNT